MRAQRQYAALTVLGVLALGLGVEIEFTVDRNLVGEGVLMRTVESIAAQFALSMSAESSSSLAVAKHQIICFCSLVLSSTTGDKVVSEQVLVRTLAFERESRRGSPGNA